jgi:ribosomal protein S18 acetylase RimI-like enzyme
MFTIRLAVDSDLNALYACDSLLKQDNQRRAYVQRAVSRGNCVVGIAYEQVRGYGVLEYSFYGHGFIPLVYIHPQSRRCGMGTALMQYLEARCQTAKLFTSTNLSNFPMQSLLAKLGYILSGVIHHLDEGDPELVYVRYIRKSGKKGNAMDEQIKQALAQDLTIDIITTGRKTGEARRTEIWFHNIDGRLYITGLPGRRDWYANLLTHPEFTFHLKESVHIDLPARAKPILDAEQRRTILARIMQKLGREGDLEARVQGSPLVEVELLGE